MAVFFAAPDGELVAARERNYQACSRLQEIADANGFDVSVRDYCGQDEAETSRASDLAASLSSRQPRGYSSLSTGSGAPAKR